MRGKLLFITGGLVGYVLGARAGRKRYDQIASAASSFWNAPPVQRRVHEARDFGLELVGDVPGALLDTGKKIASSVAGKAHKGGTSSTGAKSTGNAYPAAAAARASAARAAASQAAAQASAAQAAASSGDSRSN